MRWNLLLLTVTVTTSPILVACNDAVTEEESFAQIGQAVSVCNETVPPERIVEGIPAYAQCASSRNSPIYSNNGVDTATSAVSSEWKRTQFAGGYQCTELLNRYWLFRWNIKWAPNGDAWSWCNSDPPSSSGIVKTTTPAHGDAIVFGKGTCGSDATYGHVALVDTVDEARSRVTFVEQNQAGRRTAAWSCATCFLHVVANVGASGTPSGGATSTSTAQGGSGMATSIVASGGRASSEQNSSIAKGGRSEPVSGASTQTGGRARGGAPNDLGGTATTTDALNRGGRTARGGASNQLGGTATIIDAPSNGGRTARGGGSHTESNPSSFGGGFSRGGALASGGSENATGPASKPAGTGGSMDTSISEGSGGRAAAADEENDAAALGGNVADRSSAPEPDAGCSCSAANAQSSRPQWLGTLGLALFLRTRRTRPQRGRTPSVGRQRRRALAHAVSWVFGNGFVRS